MRAADEPTNQPDGTGEDPRVSAGVASVERAADVLLHFARRGVASLGVSEIARDLGLSKAAVHRILSSLRTRDLVSYSEDDRRYRLGPMVLALGLQSLDQLDVRRLAVPRLARLSQETSETATLSIRAGWTRVYVDQVTPSREVIMSVAIGVPYPLHSGASSKAFLAFLSDEEIAEYFEHDLDALTPRTVTDREELRRELVEIREHGWARSVGERQSGASSVAAPVFDHTGRPAAVISVAGPSPRFPADLEVTVKALLAVTTDLSLQMGHRSG